MPEQPPTLRDMIQEALDRGTTYRQLEASAIDPVTHKTASRSIFFDTVNGKLDRMPYEHHLRAIAAGLGVPYERVRQAAIRQWVPAEAPAPGTDAELIVHARQLRDRHLEEAAKAAAALARLEGRDTEAAS